MVDGKSIGKMITRFYGGSRFHAVLDIPYESLFGGVIAQGFGDSQEEAINNALVLRAKEARKFLEAVDVLAEQLGVEISDD